MGVSYEDYTLAATVINPQEYRSQTVFLWLLYRHVDNHLIAPNSAKYPSKYVNQYQATIDTKPGCNSRDVPYIWGRVCQEHISTVGTSNCITQYLCHVITCPCPWCLLLAHMSIYVLTVISQVAHQVHGFIHGFFFVVMFRNYVNHLPTSNHIRLLTMWSKTFSLISIIITHQCRKAQRDLKNENQAP